MAKKQLSAEQKRLDMDIWIIVLITMGVFWGYALTGNQLMSFVRNSSVSVIPRLLLSAGVQFGIAGLGITVVCIIRKEKFRSFGLTTKNIVPALAGTLLSFLPMICCIFASGQFDGYHPLSIMITGDVLASGLPLSLFGMAVIAVVWGFFEGFNYVVICDKINERYPSKNKWLDCGAVICAVVCLLFHPMNTSFWGIMEMMTTFIAIYGMLIVKRKTGNAWGCVFAFSFIWNAL